MGNLRTAAALVIVLLTGLDCYAAGRLNVPMLVGVLLAVLASFEATQALVRSTTRLSASIAAAERVMGLAEAPAEPLVLDALSLPRAAGSRCEICPSATEGPWPWCAGFARHLAG
jgi:ATP-binding cassette subfamily C protein CydC